MGMQLAKFLVEAKKDARAAQEREAHSAVLHQKEENLALEQQRQARYTAEAIGTVTKAIGAINEGMESVHELGNPGTIAESLTDEQLADLDEKVAAYLDGVETLKALHAEGVINDQQLKNKLTSAKTQFGETKVIDRANPLLTDVKMKDIMKSEDFEELQQAGESFADAVKGTQVPAPQLARAPGPISEAEPVDRLVEVLQNALARRQEVLGESAQRHGEARSEAMSAHAKFSQEVTDLEQELRNMRKAETEQKASDR